MKARSIHWLLGIALLALASAPRAAVTVQFVDPQRFIDATLEGYGEPPEANRALAEIRKHLLALGARCIPEEQSLSIQIRELDLAGHYEWQRRASIGNFRLLRNVVWTRMTIEYVWQHSDGTVLGKSVDRLAQTYFPASEVRKSNWEVALPDEKAMITDWFEERFCRDGKAPSSPGRRP